ncbi:MAG: DUF4143 domain-containing protein, partial [Candidatus Omnitrophica bacterium]|nr:DUF4143 domain-containing protein [Candidatus Omnitrophota bacterium]
HPKVKVLLKSPRKVYFIDNSFITFLSLKFGKNMGRLMENLVARELIRKFSSSLLEIYYWKDYQQREVDFVIKEGLKVKQLIQVTFASGKDEIEKREIKALIKASELLRCKDLLIITWDYEDEVKIKNKKIVFKPLWRWLLG